MRIQSTFFALFLPFLPLLGVSFKQAAEEIKEAGMFLNHFGLCPATSGNLSIRLDEHFVAVTASGRHKGELSAEDILVVELDGSAQDSAKKPSEETLLHTAIYIVFKDAAAVLHTHSLNAVVLTRLMASEKNLMTEGYEIHKAFPGIRTHNSCLDIPIFENSQDIDRMAAEVRAYLEDHPYVYGFLIRGHGFYTWGCDMKEAKNRVEAFEHLFAAELKIFTATKGI